MEAPNKIHSCDDKLFDSWSEKSAYLLGYLESDGYIRIDGPTLRIHFQTSDKDLKFLEKLKKLTKWTGKIGISDNWANGKCYKKVRFIITSRAWKDSRIINILGTGADIPFKYMHHYIRGYFDGDGSVFFEKQSGKVKSNFVFSSESLAKRFKDILKNQDIKVGTIHMKTNSNKCWYFNVSYLQTEKLKRYLYKNSSIYMDRKYQIFSQSDKIATEPKEG